MLMSSAKGAILEYEDILRGERQRFSDFYFKGTPYSNEQMALTIFRYACEKLLRWSPYELRDCFTRGIVNSLKLDCLLKYIDFPPELNKDTDMIFIVWKLYPNVIKISMNELTVKTYLDYCNKKIKNYPKGFFNGIEGKIRACICMQYVISQYYSFASVNLLYEMFAGDKGYEIIEKHGLKKALEKQFPAPIDYLHESLPEDYRSDLEYHFALFDKRLNTVMERQAKHDKEEE